MTNTTTFADLLAAANETKPVDRRASGLQRRAGLAGKPSPEMARLLAAALAWELATGRTATADDESWLGAARGNGCHPRRRQGQCRRIGINGVFTLRA